MPGVALASNSGSGSERIRGVDAGAERGGLPQLALDDPPLVARRSTTRSAMDGASTTKWRRSAARVSERSKPSAPSEDQSSGTNGAIWSGPSRIQSETAATGPGTVGRRARPRGRRIRPCSPWAWSRSWPVSWWRCVRRSVATRGAAWLLGIIVIPRGSLTTRHRPARLLSLVRRSGPARHRTPLRERQAPAPGTHGLQEAGPDPRRWRRKALGRDNVRPRS